LLFSYFIPELECESKIVETHSPGIIDLLLQSFSFLRILFAKAFEDLPRARLSAVE